MHLDFFMTFTAGRNAVMYVICTYLCSLNVIHMHYVYRYNNNAKNSGVLLLRLLRQNEGE